jgi:hypothetical protein
MSEDIVEPLVRFETAKKRVYRRPSRREIYQRCIQLSREIKIQSDSAGTGFEVSLHAAKTLGGRDRGVDRTASSPAETDKTTVSGSQLECMDQKRCLLRTSGGS